jgi:hypothetical protein
MKLLFFFHRNQISILKQTAELAGVRVTLSVRIRLALVSNLVQSTEYPD